jgi:hypothetical protein
VCEMNMALTNLAIKGAPENRQLLRTSAVMTNFFLCLGGSVSFNGRKDQRAGPTAIRQPAPIRLVKFLRVAVLHAYLKDTGEFAIKAFAALATGWFRCGAAV